MEKLIDQNSKSPYISLGSINIIDEAFRRHIDGRPNVDVPKILSKSLFFYFVNLAKPKSAILARPLCKKTFATFKSRWITFFCERQRSPENMSLIMGWALCSEKWCSLRSLVSRSPPLHISVMMQQFLLDVKTSQHRRMLGWLSFLRTSISEKRSSSSFWDLRELSSIILTATVSSEQKMKYL